MSKTIQSEAAERVREQLTDEQELVREDVSELLEDFDALADVHLRMVKREEHKLRIVEIVHTPPEHRTDEEKEMLRAEMAQNNQDEPGASPVCRSGRH